MSNLLNELTKVREAWYDAFYSRNIEMLDFLETEWFLSTNGRKFIYKKHQLHKLGLEDISANGYKVPKRKEFDVIIRELNNIATASGKAEIIDPCGEKRLVDFIECWIKGNYGWKLQFQSFDTPT